MSLFWFRFMNVTLRVLEKRPLPAASYLQGPLYINRKIPAAIDNNN